MSTSRRSDPRGQSDPRSLPGRSALAAALLCGLAATLAAGRDDKERPAGEPASIPLFDGTSLDGWAKTAFSRPGEVKVEDGAIVLAVGRPMTGITSTRRDLPTTDYQLDYEAMRTAGSDFFAAATFPVGASFVTLVNGGWGGSVTGLSSLDGADASENETTKSIRYRNKTWYRFRVRVTGTAIRCWVDDKEVVAVEHKGRKVAPRIEVRANQPLGFATWDTGGAVRKVSVRKLTPAEVAATDALEP